MMLNRANDDYSSLDKIQNLQQITNLTDLRKQLVQK